MIAPTKTIASNTATSDVKGNSGVTGEGDGDLGITVEDEDSETTGEGDGEAEIIHTFEPASVKTVEKLI